MPFVPSGDRIMYRCVLACESVFFKTFDYSCAAVFKHGTAHLYMGKTRKAEFV